MHRLVQASYQLWMNLSQRQRSFKMAISLIKALWPVTLRIAVHSPSFGEEQQAFLPHVQKLTEFYVTSCKNGEPLIPHDVVNWDFASILYEAGW